MHGEDDVSFIGLFVPLTTKKSVSILFTIGFVLFFVSLFNGFVGDDNTQILGNPAIHSLTNIPAFFLEDRLTVGIAKLGGGYYKPFLDTSFALIYSFFGSNAFGYHLIQTILAISNSILVFFFLKQFFKKELAFVLSVIFLVHPINSESTMYISAMQEVLFLFFGMTSMLLLSKYESQKALLLASVGLLFSLFSKETGILFVSVALLYSFLFKRRTFRWVFGYSTLVLIIYGALRAHATGFVTHAAINAPIERLSLGGRIVTTPSIIWFYFSTFLFPLNLSSSWQWVYTKIDVAHFLMPLLLDLLLFAGVGVLGWAFYRKSSHVTLYLFFTFWLVVGLAFHMQILPLDQTVAERWFYFPFVGVAGLIGLLIEKSKIELKNRLVLSCIILIISLLVMRTFIRSWDYLNDFTLAVHDSAVSDTYNLEYIISHEYYMEGKLPQAKEHALKSVSLFPYITNYTNLGAIYSSMGDYPHAKENYMKAIQYGNDALPYENLSMLALVYGNGKENIVFIKNALRKYPTNGSLWMALTEVASLNGEPAIATFALQHAKQYSKDSNLPLLEYIITNKKPLKIEVKNGSIIFYTIK